MSQLNFVRNTELENQHRHQNVKQFGASEGSRSTTKKRVLADVNVNILAQRTALSSRKLQTSMTKTNPAKYSFYNKENGKKEFKQDFEFLQKRGAHSTSQGIKQEITHENGSLQLRDALSTFHDINLEVESMREARSTCLSEHMIKDDCDTDEEYVEPPCTFCDKAEDDSADILLNYITLTKHEIDTLALEWERPPVVTEKDMRILEIPSAIPEVADEVPIWPSLELDISLLNDIPIVESFSDIEE